MTLQQDIEAIAAQEKALVFERFDFETAWVLGGLLRENLLKRGAGATAQIELAGQLLFHGTTPGAQPGQADWLRRKRNSVMRFHRSTYGLGRYLESEGTSLLERHGLPFSEYVAHGGGFPIRLTNSGVVGFIGISGLPQREDHKVIVEVVSEFLGVKVPMLD